MKNNKCITNTKYWIELSNHYKLMKNKSLKYLFKEDKNRFFNYSIEFKNILLDFSKNHINYNTINLLLNLAKKSKLYDAIDRMYSGDIINKTENRSVLHTALRNLKFSPIYIREKNISIYIKRILNKMKLFSEKILNFQWKGFTNEIITDIVNIGIGGSQIGPLTVVEALKDYKTKINIHFISNIDSSEITEILKKLKAKNTLFIISSKTFETEETIINAITAKNWFLKYAILEKNIKKHFIAVSANKKKALEFGISNENIFHFDDWVGGRYSLWGPIGLIICLAIGFDNFKSFLKGANQIDDHFKNTPFNKNIPVILALIGIWYINFFKISNHAIIPYNQYLHILPMYIQQLDMESNGKNINQQGKKINYNTSPVIFGGVGTNCQHSFYQFLHQGTNITTCDFIFSVKNVNNIRDHNQRLFSNFLSQSSALAFGKEKKEIFKKNKNNDFLLPYKIFEGNRPSNSILLNELTPVTLGNLLAIYEHKIFVQGIIWNIFSFDQWGVELGKELSKNILKDLISDDIFISKYDNSTNSLINRFKKLLN